jgi:hypothetical protein
MRTASEEKLREFLHGYLDNMEDGPRYRELKKAFDAECNRRSGAYYASLNNGEWI